MSCLNVVMSCIYWSKYWKGWTIEWVMRLPPQGVTSNIGISSHSNVLFVEP